MSGGFFMPLYYELNMENKTLIRLNLTKDSIKIIAMFTMLLNHIATIYMEPGTII